MTTIERPQLFSDRQVLFHQHDWQQEVLVHAVKKELLVKPVNYLALLTGRQSGKSTTLSGILYYLFYEPTLKNKGIQVIYFCSTYSQVRDTIWEKLVDSYDPVFPESEAEINRSTMTIRSKINGTKFSFRGTDSDRSLRGCTVDYVILDEWQDHKNQEKVWGTIQPSIAAKNGTAIFAGTARGFDDLYNKWWLGCPENPNRDPHWRSWKITTEQSGSPAGTPDNLAKARSGMSKEQFDQEYLCSPTSQRGLVYPYFDIMENTKTEMTASDAKVLHIGMDFNVNNMNAVVGVFDDKTRYLHIVDEIHLEYNSNTRTMIQEIKSRYPNHYIKVYPDASGGHSNSANISNEMTNHLLLKDAGFQLVCNKTNPPIVDRINLLNGRLEDANGVRKLFVNKQCKHMINALTQRVYINGKPDKNSGNDHMSDALEYLVWQLYYTSNNQYYFNAAR